MNEVNPDIKSLKQKWLLRKLELKLLPEKLLWRSSKGFEEDEVAVSYEDVTGDFLVKKSGNTILKIMYIGFLACSFLVVVVKLMGEPAEPNAEFIWLAAGMISFLLYMLSIKKYWKIQLTNSNFIRIRRDKPNELKVEEFLNHLLSKRNKYLITNYGSINKDIPYENQLENLNWLEKINVISTDQYQNKLSELNLLFQKNERQIGFKTEE